MIIVSYIISAVILILAILVLIKMFPREGVLKGILGIICLLYAFIWGWQHHKEEGLTNVMWAWTILFIVNLVIGGIAQASLINSQF